MVASDTNDFVATETIDADAIEAICRNFLQHDDDAFIETAIPELLGEP
jgi:hypothetical protein